MFKNKNIEINNNNYLDLHYLSFYVSVIYPTNIYKYIINIIIINILFGSVIINNSRFPSDILTSGEAESIR